MPGCGIAANVRNRRGETVVVYVRTAFLSSTGNDGTAALNDSGLPYATIDAAIADLAATYPNQVTTLRLLNDVTDNATENADLAAVLADGLTIRSHTGTRRQLIGSIPLCGATNGAGGLDLRLVNVQVSTLSDLHTTHALESIGSITGDATSIIDLLNLSGDAEGSTGANGSAGANDTGNDGADGANGDPPGDGSPGEAAVASGGGGSVGGDGDSAWSIDIIGATGFTITDLQAYGRAGGAGGTGGAGAIATGGAGGDGGDATGTDQNGGNAADGGDANAGGGLGGDGGVGGHGAVVSIFGDVTITAYTITAGNGGAAGSGGPGGTANAGAAGTGGAPTGTGNSGSNGNPGTATNADGGSGTAGAAGGDGSGILPSDLASLLAWYEPERDATAIGATTLTLTDHSGNGYDLVLDTASNVIAGPAGKKAVSIAHTTGGTIAGIPWDRRASTLVFATRYAAQGWRFIYALGAAYPTILNSLPIFYEGATVGNGSKVNPRGGVDEWQVFTMVAGPTETKGFINGRSDTEAALSAGSGTGSGLGPNIGGTVALEVVGMFVFGEALSDAAVAQMEGYIRRVLMTPETPSTGSPLLMAEGDSITHGYGSEVNVWPGLTGWNYRNRAQDSSGFTELTNRAVLAVDALYDAVRAKNVFVCLCGTNQIAGMSAAAVYAIAQTYYAARKTAGWTVVAIGLPARGDSVQDTDGFNALFRADFGVSTGITRVFAADTGITFADYFIDIGADARFQDPDDTTYYQTDKLHITDAAHTVIADEYVTPLLAIL